MATPLTTEERLAEAEQAYHELVTGQGVAEVRDQNGETIRYARADLPKLNLYIESLKQLLSGSSPCGPMRISA